MNDDGRARLDRAVQSIRAGLAELVDLERDAPGEVRHVVVQIVAHLRSWRPESVSPLGTLPAPTETIRDPRAPR